MRPRSITIFTAGLILCAVLVAVFMLHNFTVYEPHLEFDKTPIPNFKGPVLGISKSIFNSESYIGKVWVICIWSSWAPNGSNSWANLLNIPEKYRNLMIGLDYRDKEQDASNFLKKNGTPFLLSVYDPEGIIAIDLYVKGIPEILVIDKQGHVALRHVGWLEENEWKEKFEPILRNLEAAQVNPALNSDELLQAILTSSLR